MRLYLDDIRVPPRGWTWVQTPYAATYYLETEEVEEISLDHDLGMRYYGGREISGYEVLLYLEEQVAIGRYKDRVLPKMKIHSANPAAHKKMELAIQSIERMYNET